LANLFFDTFLGVLFDEAWLHDAVCFGDALFEIYNTGKNKVGLFLLLLFLFPAVPEGSTNNL
jgi:hypothetical protein